MIDFVSGPWYEMSGPSAQIVRNDVLKYLNLSKEKQIEYKGEKDKIIQNALLKIIPDTRTDFGSWRGYTSFGVAKDVSKEVIKEIRIQYAYLNLRKKFKPYIDHWLYKPGGPRMRNLSETTMVGKLKKKHY